MDVITEATTVDFIASSYSFPQVVTEELPPSCASPRYSARLVKTDLQSNVFPKCWSLTDQKPTSIVIEFFSPQNFEISKSSYCSMDKCIPKSRNLESTDGTTTRDVTGLKSLNKPPNLSCEFTAEEFLEVEDF